MDIKRVAFETRPVVAERSEPAATVKRQPLATPSVAAATGDINRDEVAAIVDRFLAARHAGQGAPAATVPLRPTAQPIVELEASRPDSPAPQTGAAPSAQNGGRDASSAAQPVAPQRTPVPPSKPNGSAAPKGGHGEVNGHKPVDFVSEDDVRRALRKGEKIYINARTIITPAARDMGEPAEVFAKI